jgi:hypothetical protein
MFDCIRDHNHETEAQRDDCNAQTYDALSMMKMAQVGFAGPAKIARHYLPGRVEERGTLKVVVFTEEQIVPWEFEDEELPETD